MSTAPLTLASLVLATFRDPRGTLRLLLAREIPVAALWQLLALIAVLIVLFEQSLQRLLGGLPEVPDQASGDPVAALILALQAVIVANPLLVAAFQVLFFGVGALALYRVGRLFGGTGSLQAALTAMGWFLIVYLVMLVVTTLVALLLPMAGLLAILAMLVVNAWLATVFTCEVHGFDQPLLVLLGIVATTVVIMLALGMLASIVLSGMIGDPNVL